MRYLRRTVVRKFKLSNSTTSRLGELGEQSSSDCRVLASGPAVLLGSNLDSTCYILYQSVCIQYV